MLTNPRLLLVVLALLVDASWYVAGVLTRLSLVTEVEQLS